MEVRNETERKWLEKFIKSHMVKETALINREPTEEEINKYMINNGENYYNSRERLREESYGGKPPMGYNSWGDYHKSL